MFSKDLSHFFDDPSIPQAVVLKLITNSEPVKFICNSVVLAAHSAKFNELILSGNHEIFIVMDMEETSEANDIVSRILTFMHGKKGILKMKDESEIKTYFKFALEWEIQALEEYCFNTIKEIVGIDPFKIPVFHSVLKLCLTKDTDLWSKYDEMYFQSVKNNLSEIKPHLSVGDQAQAGESCLLSYYVSKCGPSQKTVILLFREKNSDGTLEEKSVTVNAGILASNSEKFAKVIAEGRYVIDLDWDDVPDAEQVLRKCIVILYGYKNFVEDNTAELVGMCRFAFEWEIQQLLGLCNFRVRFVLMKQPLLVTDFLGIIEFTKNKELKAVYHQLFFGKIKFNIDLFAKNIASDHPNYNKLCKILQQLGTDKIIQTKGGVPFTGIGIKWKEINSVIEGLPIFQQFTIVVNFLSCNSVSDKRFVDLLTPFIEDPKIPFAIILEQILGHTFLFRQNKESFLSEKRVKETVVIASFMEELQKAKKPTSILFMVPCPPITNHQFWKALEKEQNKLCVKVNQSFAECPILPASSCNMKHTIDSISFQAFDDQLKINLNPEWFHEDKLVLCYATFTKKSAFFVPLSEFPFSSLHNELSKKGQGNRQIQFYMVYD